MRLAIVGCYHLYMVALVNHTTPYIRVQFIYVIKHYKCLYVGNVNNFIVYKKLLDGSMCNQ